jgi:hypothetical protein
MLWPKGPRIVIALVLPAWAFNRRTVEVTELASSLLMKDQSTAAIARVKEAYDAAAAIDARAGSQPSEQDCLDVDAIVEKLR